jgi:hypothetical protein
MWKNLLPQGTRVVELSSGIALIIVAILLIFSNLLMLPDIKGADNLNTWQILLLTFGSLQVLSIYKYPKLELIRIGISWLAGCFWIWISLVSIGSHLSIEDIGTLMLGIGNMYGFIINLNLLHISWTE